MAISSIQIFMRVVCVIFHTLSDFLPSLLSHLKNQQTFNICLMCVLSWWGYLRSFKKVQLMFIIPVITTCSLMVAYAWAAWYLSKQRLGLGSLHVCTGLCYFFPNASISHMKHCQLLNSHFFERMYGFSWVG